MDAPPVDLVRRALERALDVARLGLADDPPLPVPPGLRRVLAFTRLPPAALAHVAQAIDTDGEFRSRVAAAVDRDEVGRAAWLWLDRPPGWRDELAALVDELSVDVVPPAQERQADKSLRRRVEGAERKAARAEERATRLERELDHTRHDLAGAVAAREALDAQVAALQARADDLAAQRASAVSELKRVERLLAQRTSEARALEASVDELRSGAARRPEPPAPAGPDLDELRRAVERLAHRAADFTHDIDALRDALNAGTDAAAPPASRARRPRRAPVPIPGGLTEESDETASYLLARPRAVLLVDGYNVSMSAWGDLDIAEQRTRLEVVLADLVARTPGLTIELVFDGAEVVPMVRPGSRRRLGVTVRFTPADVEADDALLEMIERYPHGRPVLVASNDRRVRDGARRRGANVLRAEQLLSIART
jgi:predicted RNA-binding protein with PIN domain